MELLAVSFLKTGITLYTWYSDIENGGFESAHEEAKSCGQILYEAEPGGILISRRH